MANPWTSGHVVRPGCERWLGCVTDVWSCISGLTPLSPRACRWLASPALSQVCVLDLRLGWLPWQGSHTLTRITNVPQAIMFVCLCSL